MESSSAGDDCEGSGGIEVEIADRMEDPPRELIPVIEEDSNDIPILKENQDPIPIPPPCIRNTESIKIVEIALSSPKFTTNRPCSWYLVNGHEERERERSVGVRIVGKNVEIVEII